MTRLIEKSNSFTAFKKNSCYGWNQLVENNNFVSKVKTRNALEGNL